jgi:hypothetical protein
MRSVRAPVAVPKPKRSRPWKAYQRVVAEVVGILNPQASVKEGQWIEGPDGRRDLDVEIRGRLEGREILVILECKDWRSPVGIAAVDALDSKRRDVRATFAAICSNSGFTKHALRKALRNGIGMLSAVQQGNSAIRSEMYLERYRCEIRLQEQRIILHTCDGAQGAIVDDIFSVCCLGSPFFNWLDRWICKAVQEHTSARRIRWKIMFKEPIDFESGPTHFRARGLTIIVTLESSWFRKLVKIEAAAGIYDHLKMVLCFRGSINIPVEIGSDIDKEERIRREKPTSEFMKDLLPGTRGGSCFVIFEIRNTHKPIGDGSIPGLEIMIQESELTFE